MINASEHSVRCSGPIGVSQQRGYRKMQKYGIRFYTERSCEQIEGWLAANCMAGWEVQLNDVDWDTEGAMWKRLVVHFFDPSDRRTFVSSFFGTS